MTIELRSPAANLKYKNNDLLTSFTEVLQEFMEVVNLL